MTRKLTAAAALLLSAAALAAGAAPTTSATVSCSGFAATTGSDGAAGTSEAPYRTAQKLLDSLAAGETGCLVGGTYAESVRVNHGGRQGAPIRLTSRPGGLATIVGRLYVPAGSNDVVFAGLALDGRNTSNLPSPTVDADRVTFAGNDVTDGHTSICFSIGSADWGIAHDTVLDGNRVHDCGRLPFGSTNHDHGIYVEAARGTVITNNYIYDNADRGVQLYPDAQGSTVANNVIDGNGEGIIFSGDDGFASSGNVVTRNIISNASVRYNVESWWPDGNPVGTGNVVSDNCIWSGKQGNVAEEVGFRTSGNVVSDPLYADRGAKDFSLRSGSPCAGYGPAGGTPPTPPPPPPPPPAVPPQNVSAPALFGSARVGRVLTASSGAWSGQPTSLAYAWLRCDYAGSGCVPTSAGGARYTLSTADAWHTVRVTVRAQNAAGSTSVTSAPSPLVQAKRSGKAATKQSLRHRRAKRRALLRLAYSIRH